MFVKIVTAVRYAFKQHRVEIAIAPNKLHAVCRKLREVRPALSCVTLKKVRAQETFARIRCQRRV